MSRNINTIVPGTFTGGFGHRRGGWGREMSRNINTIVPGTFIRFEREANLLATLSHQNVATLHGLEEREGQRFLVMELVEGEPLAERIKKGPKG